MTRKTKLILVSFLLAFIGACKEMKPITLEDAESSPNAANGSSIVTNQTTPSTTPPANPVFTPPPPANTNPSNSTAGGGSGSTTPAGNNTEPVKTESNLNTGSKEDNVVVDDIGVQDLIDCTVGDGVDRSSAPASYGVTTHRMNAGLRIGASVFPNPAPECHDNDGLQIPSTLKYGQNNRFMVTVSGGGGTFHAWIDFNGDGDFLDDGEQVLANGGDFAIGIPKEWIIPFPASPGPDKVTTWMRLRYGPSGLNPTVPANAGEVEDHQITILK